MIVGHLQGFLRLLHVQPEVQEVDARLWKYINSL